MLTSNQKQLKSTVIQWSDQQKFHFEKVKAALGKKTVLSYPIPYAESVRSWIRRFGFKTNPNAILQAELI